MAVKITLRDKICIISEEAIPNTVYVMYTYSEASIFSLEGMIIIKQLRRMVVMIMSEKSGWTRMWMATRLTGEKGEMT